MFKCSECSYSFLSTLQLILHYEHEHNYSQTSPYTCGNVNCQRIFVGKQLFTKHMNSCSKINIESSSTFASKQSNFTSTSTYEIHDNCDFRKNDFANLKLGNNASSSNFAIKETNISSTSTYKILGNYNTNESDSVNLNLANESLVSLSLNNTQKSQVAKDNFLANIEDATNGFVQIFQGSKSLPHSVVQKVVEECDSFLNNGLLESFENAVLSVANCDDLKLKEIKKLFLTFSECFTDLNSHYLRKKHLIETKCYIAPQSLPRWS